MPLQLESQEGRWVHRLGYAGLVPFVGNALLMFLVTEDVVPLVAIALTSYGAVIASFLGGLHWGLALRQDSELRTFHLLWGVIPSLVAWVAVVMPAYAGLPLLSLVLLACYLVDRKTWPAAGLRHWMTLRFRLTVVSVLSCLLGAASA
ncbi:MAG: DUF3429 domain-containing protein [Alphaproteobacteria bacterium]|nr:DUF3429 domain-containing protein [Alphaproteobacteria bacterium]